MNGGTGFGYFICVFFFLKWINISEVVWLLTNV